MHIAVPPSTFIIIFPLLTSKYSKRLYMQKRLMTLCNIIHFFTLNSPYQTVTMWDSVVGTDVHFQRQRPASAWEPMGSLSRLWLTPVLTHFQISSLRGVWHSSMLEVGFCCAWCNVSRSAVFHVLLMPLIVQVRGQPFSGVRVKLQLMNMEKHWAQGTIWSALLEAKQMILLRGGHISVITVDFPGLKREYGRTCCFS